MHATLFLKSPWSAAIRRAPGSLFAVLLLIRTIAPSSAQIPFFADGQTSWRVCLAATNAPAVRFAVEELTNALKQVSGADFPVQQGGEVPTRGAIVVGDLTHPLVAGLARALKLEPGEVEQSAVRTIDERLFLAGNQPRGALYAVYEFLNQQLGVR